VAAKLECESPSQRSQRRSPKTIGAAVIERAMKLQHVILKAMAKKIGWMGQLK
jgi:hypothetical protein